MLLWRSLDPRTLLAVLASVRRDPPPKPGPDPRPQASPVAAEKPVA